MPVIRGLELIIVICALALAAVAIVFAVTDRPRPEWYRPTLHVGEAVLLGQAAAAVLLIARGHRPDELVTFAAYAITSVLVVPVLLTLLSGGDEDYGGPRWPHVLVAVAGVAVAVIVVRMGQTWPGTGG